MHEIKIKKKVLDDKGTFLIAEPCEDLYLIWLKIYLFQHWSSIQRILEILNDESVIEYGGNLMFTRKKGSLIFIYDHTDYDPERFQIIISRVELIKIFKAWLELKQLIGQRGGIIEIILQRDEEHIYMIAHYEDGSEFRRTFNYKV